MSDRKLKWIAQVAFVSPSSNSSVKGFSYVENPHNALWTNPRPPIRSRLGFSLSRKAYSVLLGGLRSTGAVWMVIDFSPLIPDNRPIGRGYNGWRCGMIRRCFAPYERIAIALYGFNP